MTIKEHIKQLIAGAVQQAQGRGALPDVPVDEVPIERPQNPEHGDFASSLPLKLARPMRMNPYQIAEAIASLVQADEAIERAWAARPGFINFALKTSWVTEQVNAILQAGETYGSIDIGAGARMQVEFVSGNPTGPLHVGHARGGVFGSALASVLEASGYDVQREYYVNDSGNQIDQFRRSLHVRYQQLFGRQVELPTDGYHGQYMIDLAQEIRAERGDQFLNMPEEQATVEIGEVGLQKMLASVRDDVALLRIQFDQWFSERSLYENSQYRKAMSILDEKGCLVEREGAIWFTRPIGAGQASSAPGEDRDDVLVRRTGVPTYFASDVAYHYNKFAERHFDHVINVWGADHHGHVPRLKAAVEALGIPPEKLTIIITQIVTLKRGGEVVRLSKRSGDIITLRELVEEVGADACRFFFLSRSAESQMDFDLELAKEQSAENPVYYVQYAHARIASILRLARERGIDYADGDVSLLTHDAELALVRKMLLLPELMEVMARNLEPHHLPHYAQELATAFHWFYQSCRVVSSEQGDEAITRARLKLTEAARVVLARCLHLMGMTAPERM